MSKCHIVGKHMSRLKWLSFELTILHTGDVILFIINCGCHILHCQSKAYAVHMRSLFAKSCITTCADPGVFVRGGGGGGSRSV